jgi:ribosomal protein S18 acetylase RimI-like enzyme
VIEPDTADKPQVLVTIATPEDIEDLLPLYQGFMRHESVEPPSDVELSRRLARLVKSESDEVFIARLDTGAAVAYLQQRYFFSVWRPDVDAYIEDVFVIEALRGRGIGEQLLRRALETAQERPARRICLDCNEQNLRGRRLYERLGFLNTNPAWGDARQLYYSRPL